MVFRVLNEMYFLLYWSFSFAVALTFIYIHIYRLVFSFAVALTYKYIYIYRFIHIKDSFFGPHDHDTLWHDDIILVT